VTADTLGLIGIALKAGRVAVGEEPVSDACRSHGAKLILLASDTAENSVRRAEKFAEAGKTPCLTAPCTKEELGRALGRTSCAMIAVTDTGLASGLLAKLAEQEPERYGECAEILKTASEREIRRRKEEKARERKKRKPWAAPPGKTGRSDAKLSNGGGPV